MSTQPTTIDLDLEGIDAILDSLEETGIARVRAELDGTILAVRERMLARGMPDDSVLVIAVASMGLLTKFS